MAGYIVTGYVDGVAYTATVGGGPWPNAKASAGVLSGPPRVVNLVAARAGETIRRPHQPPVTVDLDDPDAVLAALRAWTRVSEVQRR